MSNSSQKLEYKKSWYIFISLILTLLITIFYYWDKSSGVQIPRNKPITLWMLGHMPAVAIFLALAATVGLYIYKKKRLIVSKQCQLLTYLGCTILFIVFNPWAFTNLAQLPLSVVSAAALFFLSAAILGRASYAVWPVIFFLSLLIYGAKYQNITIGKEQLTQIFSTSWHDASYYITTGNILICMGALAISIAAWHLMYRIIKKENRYTLFSNGLMLFLPALVVMLILKNNIAVNSQYAWPIGCTQQFVIDCKNARDDIKRIHQLLSMLPTEQPTATIPADSQYNNVVCILHIGESVSANHLHINGYERDTTPWLTSQKSIINFKDCVASAIVTDLAVLTMITNGRRNMLNESNPDYLPSSPGLVDFFKKSGFKCATFWADYYLKYPGSNLLSREIEYYNRMADETYGFEEPFYMNQLPDIFNFIKKNDGSNIFLMINNTGSHAFFTGYDSENPPYPIAAIPKADMKPTENKEHAEIFVNAYDSTIHQTDRYISKIVDYLKGRPFIYIYMSDHGEYLGDHGYWQRNQVPFEQFHQHQPSKVPFFIYASPEFEAACPHFTTALQQLRANRHMSTAHEHLFHTVLGVMNIQTPYYNQSLDLSTPVAEPYTGPHPDKKNNNK